MSAAESLGAWTDQARSRALGSRVVPHLALLVVFVIWSGNATVLKFGLQRMPAVGFATVRLAIGTLVLVASALLLRRDLRRVPPLRLLLPAAVCGIVVNQVGWTWGVKLSTAIDASLIMGISPIVAAAGLFAITRERPPSRRLLGLGLGLVGLVLVVLAAARGGGSSFLGDALATTAPVTWAIYILIAARFGDRYDSLVFLTWTALIALALMIPMGAVDLAHSRTDWLAAAPALVYAGVLATALGYVLYFWALPRLGVTETAVYTYMQPLLGAAMAAVILREPFGAAQGLGAALILAAAYLGSWSRVKPPAPAEPT